MWTTLNIVAFLGGLALSGYAKKIDRSENYQALGIGVIGVAIAVGGVISAVVELVVK